ncbi:MAG: pseudouridine synthase [Bacillota bacterium]|nr:16S rRNA pseudouridine(516) synthase [Bacillota bacterium]
MAGEKLRLDRLLANMGLGTRREVKQIIKEGRVLVDGEAAGDAGLIVDSAVQIISVAGQVISYRKYIYLMLHKPAGLISATTDDRERTVVDLIGEDYRFYQPFPVGRLDKDTEGLLLLTNDGKWAHELTSPKKHVPKTYYVEMRGALRPADAAAVRRGIALGDFTSLPGELTILRSGEQSAAQITIYEGKFHQVKRMMAALGKEVTYLKRLSMGDLQLDERLKPGEYRELTVAELLLVKET